MSREKGFKAEDLACSYLQENGFEIIKRNFFCKYGEIDIIAFKDKVIHFVEVKSGEGFEPIYAITPTKIKKITKTINFFLMQFNPQSDYCIDGLIIKDSTITFIENITA